MDGQHEETDQRRHSQNRLKPDEQHPRPRVHPKGPQQWEWSNSAGQARVAGRLDGGSHAVDEEEVRVAAGGLTRIELDFEQA